MNLKELTSTKKGQLILCCSVLAAVWGFLLIHFGMSYLGELPDPQKIAAARKELDKIRREYETVRAESRQNTAIRRRYREIAAESWITSLDGAVETILRRRINETAEVLEFKLNSVGSVRVGRINPEFVYADIDIAGAGDLNDVITFLAGLTCIEPRLAWRRLDLRPDTRFRRSSGAGSANLAARYNELPVTRLNFSGTLRVLGYEGPLTVEDLKITRVGLSQDEILEMQEFGNTGFKVNDDQSAGASAPPPPDGGMPPPPPPGEFPPPPPPGMF